jgi:hypothetical protein
MALMKIVGLIISCALGALVLTPVSDAATPEFQLSPHVGVGSLEVDQFVGVNDEQIDTNTVGMGFGAAYLTSPGILLEIGVEGSGNLSLFELEDDYSLTERFAAIGYQAELGSGWRLVPRVGYAGWRLRSEESPLFNPGPEEVREVRGNDVFWGLSLSRRISRVVTMGVSYRQGSYDFGAVRTTSFHITLAFGGSRQRDTEMQRTDAPE